jgi:Glycosyl transferase family 2
VAESLVTVIIPTRNRLRYLKEAVESVRRQTYCNWELVVVDDVSQDGTWEWLQMLAAPRILALRQPAHGERSAARNRGLAEARGEYVLFLDDDDRLTRQAIESLVRAIKRYPDAALAVGARVVFDERGNRARAPHPRIPVLRREPWREALIGWVSIPGQTLFHAGILREAGGWDARLATPEDQELLLRLGMRGACVVATRVVLENRAHRGQWRPPDTAATEEEFRRKFVGRLLGSRRQLGERLLVARALLKEAATAYQARRFVQTARLLNRAARTTPEAIWSPLIGPGVLALWLKALIGVVVGGRVFASARVIRNKVRRARASDVVGTVRVVDRSARLER